MIMKIVMMIMILMMNMIAVFVAVKLNFNGCPAIKSYNTNKSFSHKCTKVFALYWYLHVVTRQFFNTPPCLQHQCPIKVRSLCNCETR